MTVVNRTTNGTVTIKRREDAARRSTGCGRTAQPARSTSCVENRQRTLYDRKLPGDGLLVYHVDETIDGNDDENHPFVKLLEADGRNHLHDGANRGDAGDPYPGSSKNVALTSASNPSSKSYGGQETFVTITNIGASGANMKATITVKGPAQSRRRRKRRRPRRPSRPRRQSRETGIPPALDSSRGHLELSVNECR